MNLRKATDPYINHFAQADTLIPGAGSSQAWDRYAYAMNNPLRYIDPSGHCSISFAIFVGCGYYDQIIRSTFSFSEPERGHAGLGTQTNNNTILTHNHQQSPLEDYKVAGFSVSAANSDVYGDKLPPNGSNPEEQTRLITFPSDLPGTSSPIANTETTSEIGWGSIVSVARWDEQSGITASWFFVVKTDGNGMTLWDPFHILQGGDSGGGIFYKGKLVGNLWSIAQEGQGDYAFAVSVPDNVDNSTTATSPVVTPTDQKKE